MDGEHSGVGICNSELILELDENRDVSSNRFPGMGHISMILYPPWGAVVLDIIIISLYNII